MVSVFAVLLTACQNGETPDLTDTLGETGETGETVENQSRLDPRLCVVMDETPPNNESTATVNGVEARLYMDFGQAYYACPGLLEENTAYVLVVQSGSLDRRLEFETGEQPSGWALPEHAIRFEDLLRNNDLGSMYIKQIEFMEFDLSLTGSTGAYTASLENSLGSWPSTRMEIQDSGAFELQVAPTWRIPHLDEVLEYKSEMTFTGFLNADGTLAQAWFDIEMTEDPSMLEVLGPPDGEMRYACGDSICFQGSLLRQAQ